MTVDRAQRVAQEISYGAHVRHREPPELTGDEQAPRSLFMPCLGLRCSMNDPATRWH
jgi:hypothetical protein